MLTGGPEKPGKSVSFLVPVLLVARTSVELAAEDKCGSVEANAVRETSMNTVSFYHCLKACVFTASSTAGTALSRVCMVTMHRGHYALSCAALHSVMGSPFFPGQSGLSSVQSHSGSLLLTLFNFTPGIKDMSRKIDCDLHSEKGRE